MRIESKHHAALVSEQTGVIEKLEAVLRARELDLRKSREQHRRCRTDRDSLKQAVARLETRAASVDEAYKVAQGHTVVADRQIRSLEARLVERERELRQALASGNGAALRARLQELRIQTDKTNKYRLKYIRAESFRKALVYQKRYLILLLGGFRESEGSTLRALSRPIQPSTSTSSSPPPLSPPSPSLAMSHSHASPVSQRLPVRRGLERFRRAAVAVRAAARLKLLSQHWREASEKLSKA